MKRDWKSTGYTQKYFGYILYIQIYWIWSMQAHACTHAHTHTTTQRPPPPPQAVHHSMQHSSFYHLLPLYILLLYSYFYLLSNSSFYTHNQILPPADTISSLNQQLKQYHKQIAELI